MIFPILYVLVAIYCTYRFHGPVHAEMTDHNRKQQDWEDFMDSVMSWVASALGGLFWPLVLTLRLLFVLFYKGKPHGS